MANRLGTGRDKFAVDIDGVRVNSAVEIALPTRTPKFIEKKVAGVLGTIKKKIAGNYELGDSSLKLESLEKVNVMLNDGRSHIITAYTTENLMDTNTRTELTINVKYVLQVQFGEINPGTLTSEEIDGYSIAMTTHGMEVYYGGVEQFYYYPTMNICREMGVDVLLPYIK